MSLLFSINLKVININLRDIVYVRMVKKGIRGKDTFEQF